MRQDSLFRSRTVPVLVPTPSERPYSYMVPEGMDVEPGSIVAVPLGPRLVAGVVWDDASDEVDPKKLRAIEHLFDCPPVTADMRRFVDWVSRYT
ncbi:MAG: primosomal protein N', partial [Oricola sp.]